MNSIRHLIEIFCFTKDLSYGKYLQWHAPFKSQGAVLSENGYSLLKAMFDQELSAL